MKERLTQWKSAKVFAAALQFLWLTGWTGTNAGGGAYGLPEYSAGASRRLAGTGFAPRYLLVARAVPPRAYGFQVSGRGTPGADSVHPVPPRQEQFGPTASREPARFLRFDEVRDIIAGFTAEGLAGAGGQDSSSWDSWVRARDTEIRGRVDRGFEDSICNFILYGTSFTSLPRLESYEAALTGDRELSEAAQARVHALVRALERPAVPGAVPPVAQSAGAASAPMNRGASSRNERLDLVREFLRKQLVAQSSALQKVCGSSTIGPLDQAAEFPKTGTSAQRLPCSSQAVEAYFRDNLKRFIQEQHGYQENLQAATKAGDAGELLLKRGTLFAKRGLSADTSLLPNWGLEDTLGALVRKGVLRPGSIRSIAVIGPGMDFADKREGYDFYPLQTVQPFALVEAVARLGLARPENVQVVAFDLNSAVLAHLARLSQEARRGRPYIVQLPRDSRTGWKQNAMAYWEHFGDVLGAPTPPLPVPPGLTGVVSRAVAIRPQVAAHVRAVDLDVVAQTLDSPPGDGFDLVVATNVLVYYDLFQQALAMASVAHMMNPQGLFLVNHALPSHHPPELEYLGRRSISYSENGEFGDDVVVYKRR